MNVSITVRHCGETTTLRAEAGTPLAPLLREAGLLTLPCGVGKCGKCLILAATEPCAEERALLGDAALASGLRLACYTRAAEGLDIALPQAGALRVLTRFAQSDYPFRPIVERRPFAMPEPSLDDQRSDLQRLIDACGAKGHALGLGQLAALPAFIRNARSNGGCGDGHGNVCGFGLMHGETLVGYTASDEAYALIVDIGTTTVAALLVDTARRHVVAARGEHNAQSPYGADVISRIRHETEWEEHRNGPNPLQQAIAKQVSAMLAGLLEQAGIGDVDFLSLTGNTTMMHLLCGLPGEHIGKAPFIPATLEPMRLPAADLGIASQAPRSCYPAFPPISARTSWPRSSPPTPTAASRPSCSSTSAPTPKPCSAQAARSTPVRRPPGHVSRAQPFPAAWPGRMGPSIPFRPTRNAACPLPPSATRLRAGCAAPGYWMRWPCCLTPGSWTKPDASKPTPPRSAHVLRTTR